MFSNVSHASLTSPSSSGPTHNHVNCSPYGYLFAGAQTTPTGPNALDALDELGEAMIDQEASPNDNSQIPPIFTYFGQFIDHDITAGTDRNQDGGKVDADTINPRDRDEVTKQRINFRTGRLDLDSLYGNTLVAKNAHATDEVFLTKLQGLMRFPADKAKMRIAFFKNNPNKVAKPADRAGDLLRLGRLIKEGEVASAELQGLSNDLQKVFLDSNGQPNFQRAILGDGRNDENLIIAQFQLAMLRFHNRVVDTCNDEAVLKKGREEVFNWARENVIRTYQWLVINEYLPTICNSDILNWVISNNAPLSAALSDSHVGCPTGHMIMPMEFAVAGFRFGHSMVRSSYDWNPFFGRPDSDPASDNRATFKRMFEFTGNGKLSGTGDQLPENWGAEWNRMTEGPIANGFADRAARKIDTHLSLRLANLPQENAILAHLARRNLRRGYLLNIPSAQDCIQSVTNNHGLPLPVLSGSELGEGAVKAALEKGGFMDATPLWYYVLREAEVLEKGERLGPLGSLLVADTLVGIIMRDKNSYWNTPGTDSGRWHPQDGAMPAGQPVTSVRALLKAALLL